MQTFLAVVLVLFIKIITSTQHTADSKSRAEKVQVIVKPEKTDLFKRLIDVATLIVISLGLYFAWDQARKINETIAVNNRTVNLSTWASITSETLEIDKIFIDNPNMQQYIYGSIDIKQDNPELQKATAIAAEVLDYFDSVLSFVWYMHAHVPEELVEEEAWDRYITQTMKSSPLMCRMLSANPTSYGSQTRRIALPACTPLATPPT